jgi:hypothetical protein
MVDRVARRRNELDRFVEREIALHDLRALASTIVCCCLGDAFLNLIAQTAEMSRSGH